MGNFADALLLLAAAIWTKSLTGSDAAAGLMLAMLGLPALLAPLIGQVADRLPRRKLMMANYAAAGLVVLPLLLVRSVDLIWLAYVVIFLYATVSYFAAAAQSGLIKDLLPDRLLGPSNSLLSSIDQGFRIIAPPAGAAIFGLWGIGPIAIAASASFFVAVALLWRLRGPKAPEASAAVGGFWGGSLDGFAFILHHRQLRAASLTVAIAVGATGALSVTNFATIEQGLGQGPGFLAVLAAVQGAVSIIGALSSSMVMRRVGPTGTMVIGTSILAVALPSLATSSIPIAMAGIVLIGFGVPWGAVAYITLRQSEAPSGLQGRVGAATYWVFNVPQLVTAALAAALVGVIDYRVVILGCAAMCLAGTLPLLCTRILSDRTPAQSRPD
ncbi:MFS transporter [Paenarthrobacter nitroguajacolicus]